MGNDGHIWTSEEEKRIYKFNKKDGNPVFVAECPGVRFNGLAVCLSTSDMKEIKKILFMTGQFKRLWEEIARRQGTRLKV